MRHDPKIFDVAVLGTGVGGLIAATRLAKENRSVLLLKERKYQLFFKRDGYCFIPFSNFSQKRIKTNLLKKIPFPSGSGDNRRQREKPESNRSAQVILPEGRIDLYREPPLLRREWKREFPGELNSIENFYAELGRIRQYFIKLKQKEPSGAFFPIRQRSWIKRWFFRDGLPRGGTEKWFLSLSSEFKKFIELQVMAHGYLLSDSFPISLLSYLLWNEEDEWERRVDPEIMTRSLLETLVQGGGRVEEIDQVENIETKRKKGFSFTYQADARTFRSRYLVLNGPLHRMSDLFGKKGGILATWDQRIRPRYVLIPFFLGVLEKVIPVGMGDLLISILNLEKPYERGNLLLLSLSEKGDTNRAPEGKRALTVQSLMPFGGSDRGSSALRDGVMDHLKHLFPFLEDHIEFIDQRWAEDQVDCWSYPHYFYETDSGFQWRSGIVPIRLSKNIYFSGRENFPYLGLEGEILSGELVGEELSRKYR